MFLEQLSCQQFKNLADQTIDIAAQPGITVFIGENGHGKTNTLEAVRLLAIPKPLRTRSLPDLIRHNSDIPFFTIKGRFAAADTTALEFGFQLRPRRRLYKANAIEVPVQQFIGKCKLVLFTPDDLQLVLGAPSLRRKLLDTVLTQISPEYFLAMQTYYKALKQRNRLLKSSSEITYTQAAPWDQQMLPALVTLLKWRQQLIEHLNQQIEARYQAIAQTKDNVTLSYSPIGNKTNNSDPAAPSIMLSELETLYEKQWSQDQRAGHTTLGAHRGDWSIALNNKPAAVTASRGELRTLALALKILELHFIEQTTAQLPLLLLDDVFSELDGIRRHALLEVSGSYQTLITTVSEHYFQEFSGLLTKFSVKDGLIG